MRCSDDQFYIVKFYNNPQHRRLLANELLATRLAEHTGLPVPATELVEVQERLIKQTPDLYIQLEHSIIPCQPGLQFGSRYATNPCEGQVFDDFPMGMLDRVRNLETFAGILALDKWTGNVDRRQAAFWRKLVQRRYTAIFIDQGYCFNGGEWTFPDHSLQGAYARNEVYAGVRGWQSFEPWLSRIENMEEQVVRRLATEIPPEWYGGEWSSLETLVTRLISRRGIVRDLIGAFGDSARNPFPKWYRQRPHPDLFSRLESA